MRRVVPVGIALALVAIVPATSEAQLDRFVQELGVLVDLLGTQQASDLDELAARMTAAIEGWDRTIADLERRTADSLKGASPAQAFGLHMELGFAYQRRGRVSDALDQFDAAAAVRPTASDVHVWRGLALEAAGKPNEAGQAFRRAWVTDAVNPIKTYYALSRRGALSAGERERAAQILRATYQQLIAGTPPHASAPFPTWGVVQDDRAGAPAVADSGLTKPVTLFAANRFDEGVAALRRWRDVAGRDAQDSPRARFEQGRVHEAEGRTTDARRDYEAALAGALTGRSVLYVLIGRLSQVDGDASTAIDAFAHAIALTPNDPLKRRDLASVYAADGRTDDAFAELVAALLIDTGNTTTLAAIGQLDLAAGHEADAVAAFRRALELRPDRFETRYSLGTALTRLGRGDEATREFELFERARREAEARTRDAQATGAR